MDGQKEITEGNSKERKKKCIFLVPAYINLQLSDIYWEEVIA